jgi:hypothetical protein
VQEARNVKENVTTLVGATAIATATAIAGGNVISGQRGRGGMGWIQCGKTVTEFQAFLFGPKLEEQGPEALAGTNQNGTASSNHHRPTLFGSVLATTTIIGCVAAVVILVFVRSQTDADTDPSKNHRSLGRGDFDDNELVLRVPRLQLGPTLRSLAKELHGPFLFLLLGVDRCYERRHYRVLWFSGMADNY